MHAWLAVRLLALLALLPLTGHAQGIDCSKARTPTEKAICASPALRALDAQVATAYAGALARQPERREAMRTELLAWLRARDAACNVPAAAIERCLSQQLTERLAALAPPPPPAAPVQPAPLQPAPLQQAAEPSFPDAAIPDASFNPPPPAATLEAQTVPAAAESDTLLHVTSPGRFSIQAHSPSGAALQIVDMLMGPSDTYGAAGSQDGRIDILLGRGTFKLRVFAAAGASDPVRLSVTPFHDAAPPAALPPPARPLGTTLRDGEQRAFWLMVPPGGGDNVRIEAAGRSLADLRLWRNGRELTALAPQTMTVTPAPGHPMLDVRIVGHAEPGTYLAVAYGGPAMTWTDGDAAQPFHLRAGVRDDLLQGWAGGTVGPFGSEVFSLPSFARAVRLDLPAPAPADLLAGDAADGIAKNSREPTVTIPVAKDVRTVELRAAAGQPFTLRPLDTTTQRVFARRGTWWVSAASTGMGGDELPPAALLIRRDGPDKPAQVAASTVPSIGPTASWHARFNLRGPASLLFQVPTGGDIAFKSTGVDITGGRSLRNVLAPGYAFLSLQPKPGAFGTLDAVVGQAGATPPPLQTPLPPDPVIPLGLQTLTPGQSLTLESSEAAGATAGLSVRAAPVALAEGPLIQTVAAGTSLSVPVAIAPGGTLSVTEPGVGPIAAGQTDNTQPGRATVVIPVSDKARTVVLSWRPIPTPPPAIPPPPGEAALAAVTAGTPAFFDLLRNEERGFDLTVPEGGLFRVETLGRLHTAGRLATPFISELATADGNGAGQNLLLQTALNAGHYRVDVRAVDSAGHLGLLAQAAPLLPGSTLLPGGSVRTALPGGTGVAYPVTIAVEGRYHLDVLSLGAPWTGRLEDAEGWPLVRPGALDGLEPALRPGQYRLVVTPPAVARDVVARLRRIEKPAEITGHGPHDLPFEQPQSATWREPAGRDDPRTPDQWSFTLPGPAEATVTLSDGMAAELQHGGTTVTRVVGHWTGTLDAGGYTLLASSLGRNDRLGYTVGVSSPVLQPGAPRMVTLPATIPLSLGESRVASLTSWGNTPVKAVLRREGGGVVARANGRADDWNVAIARLLPAGQYVLSLQPATPPDVTAPSQADSPADDGDAPDDDDQAAQTGATTGPAAPAKSDAAGDDSAPAPDASGTVEIRLALPPALPPVPAPREMAAALPAEGAGVHVLTLPQPPPGTGSLLVAAAAASAPSVLALERQDGAEWRTVSLAEGRAPVVAAPADGGQWRLEAWTVDGGPEPIRLAAQAVTADAQTGPVTLTAVPGMPVAVAHAALAVPGIAAIEGGPAGLLAGGWPGHALLRAASTVALPGRDLWLVAPEPGGVTVRSAPFPAGQNVTVDLAAGLDLPLPATDGALAMWRVASGTGRPDLGLAYAGGGDPVALAAAPLVLHAAGRTTVTRYEPKLAAPVTATFSLRATVPPGSALPVSLPAGDKAVQLDLGPGLTAFAGWHDPLPFSASAGDGRLTETLEGAWTDVLLVNTAARPAPATINVQPAPPATTLRPGTVQKRFFGAAGSFGFAFDAPPGSRLMTAGAVRAKAIVTAEGASDGAVAGPGRAWIEHGAGPVALWLDSPGVPAWPAPAPQTLDLPARLALSGPAAAFAFTTDGPALLHIATTAPVLAGLQQEAPAMFASGAAMDRAVPGGPVSLLLVSPDDGPLGGTLSVAAEPLHDLTEGLGEAVAVGPGGSAAWTFTLPKTLTIGVGVRAEPDEAAVRLLDAHGAVVGTGVAQLRTLPAGAYVLEAHVPGANPAVLRPALVGLTPRGNVPPPDIVQSYLELAGLKPQGTP